MMHGLWTNKAALLHPATQYIQILNTAATPKTIFIKNGNNVYSISPLKIKAVSRTYIYEAVYVSVEEIMIHD